MGIRYRRTERENEKETYKERAFLCEREEEEKRARGSRIVNTRRKSPRRESRSRRERSERNARGATVP